MFRSRSNLRLVGGFLAAVVCCGTSLAQEKEARQQPAANHSARASVTIVEFADFECTFCARQAPILRKLQAEYPGKVEIVFKHFPLPFHSHARAAHLAALAAGDQGRFWEMHDLIYQHQGHFAPSDFEGCAAQLGLDLDRFRKSLQAESAARVISDDVDEGNRLGVTGTPTLLIDGRQLEGVRTYPSLKRIVDAEFAGASWDGVGRQDASPIAVDVNTADAPVRGPKSAAVTIVEFSDFQCPYCAQAAPFLKRLVKINGGQVRWVFRSFPLAIHGDAPLAHMAALAAGEQGKFWEMHDLVFAHPKTIKHDDLMNFAAQLQLDVSRFQRDLTSSTLQGRLERDKAEGTSLGIEGTPTFVINGEMVAGYSEARLSSLITRHLKASTTGPAAGARGVIPVSAGNLPDLDLALGPADAPIQLEWYADLDSPLTPRASVALQRFLSAHPGTVRVQFRNFIVSNHSSSMLVHEFAMAAAAQGKFWTIEALLLADRRPKDRKLLWNLAEEAGLDAERLWADVDAKKYDAVILADLRRAEDAGIKGTPCFVVNGNKLEGVESLQVLEKSMQAHAEPRTR
jgi:protein-disulfide isomerase